MHEATPTLVLLRAWHAGQREALDELLARDLPWVRAYVGRRCGDLLAAHTEPDDMVQEAALQALQYAPRFLMSDREQFRALLGRMTENVLRDQVQRLHAQKRDVSRERSDPSDTLLCLDPAASAVTRPSEAAARSEERQWVRLAIEMLDADDRRLVLLREWHGLGFADIGAQLGTGEDAARMRFTRVLPKLARMVRQLRSGALERALGEATLDA